MRSLLDNFENLLFRQMAAVLSLCLSVAWGAVQNFADRLSAPTIVGPGKVDILRYGLGIVQAKDSREACRAAAEGIYGLLLPGFGDLMAPMVSGVTNITAAGSDIGGSTDSGSQYSWSATPGSSVMVPGSVEAPPGEERDREPEI